MEIIQALYYYIVMKQVACATRHNTKSCRDWSCVTVMAFSDEIRKEITDHRLYCEHCFKQ